MNIVMTGYDLTVFDPNAASDTLKRLKDYAALLNTIKPDTKLIYCVLGAHSDQKPFHIDGLSVLPVAGKSIGLYFTLFSLFKRLQKTAPISTFAAQSAYLDGFVCWLASYAFRARLVLQVHNDPFAAASWPARLKQKLAFFLFSKADVVRVVNPVLTQKLRALFPQTDFRFVPVPVTLQAIPREAVPETPLILCVSRLSPEKGVDLLLEAVALVAQKLPAIKVLIAGEGPEKKALLAQQKALGLEASVSFLGAVPHDTLAPLYKQASVLALTSHEEGLGRVIIEAFLQGVPVVATQTAGAEALLSGTDAGFLCPLSTGEETPQAIAEALLRLLQDSELNKKMGQAAFELGKSFDPRSLAKAWVACFF